MTPEQRAARRQVRREAEAQRIREAGAAKARELVAERGPIPDQILREIVRPALIEGAQHANRSSRKGA